MTLNGSTLCNIIQSFPVLLILAQNNNKCLKTPFIYTPPSPTHSPDYYAAYDALLQSLFTHDCDHSYPQYGHSVYGYGKKWAQDYAYYKPCNGHNPIAHSHPTLQHGYGYPHGSTPTEHSHSTLQHGYSYPHGSTPTGHAQPTLPHGYVYGSKSANLQNTTYVYKYAPNQVTNTKHKYKVVVLKNGRGRKKSEKLQSFFPQREDRRQTYGFMPNFFPNPRRITNTLSGILNFRPGNRDRNQQFYPSNNIPGITDNTNYPYQFNQRPNNIRFPMNGEDIPNDNVNFEPPYNPNETIKPNENNNDNTEVISDKNGNGGVNTDNGGLVSGVNNEPIFGNNENGGLITGQTDNGGLVSSTNDNGGLNSDHTDNGELISGNNDDRPVFGEIEDDGALSVLDDEKEPEPSPVMVVEEAEDSNIPVFNDRNSEIPDQPPADIPTSSEATLTEGKNNIFGSQDVFSETCQTVDGGVGSCISILSCSPYANLLQQAQTNAQAVRVLRGAHCGFEGNNPKVCCPRPGIPDAPPPQPPQPQPQQPTASPKDVDGGAFSGGFLDPPACGVSNASFSRVVGGINAKLGDFPWMALLGYKNKRDGSTRWLCGGSLISSRHVLTAAHCIHNHEDDLYIVRLGELDLAREDDGATPIDVPIRSKTKHEGYDAKAYINDIGILLLDRNVQFTALIQPICIPKDAALRARNFVDYNPIIAGWGDIQFRGPTATHLQVLQLPVVSNEFCSQAYAQYKAQVIDSRVLCAGYKNGGKDACQGDSGGPLMQPIWNAQTYKTYFYQIGVVSFGKRCAEAGFPGVYTRVTEFVPWIEKTLASSA